MPIESKREEQQLEVDGVKLGYLETGIGPPVIVFAADNDHALDLIKKLADSHRTISIKPPGETYQTAGGWLERLALRLARLGIERCSVIGISAGARLALTLALAAPEWIDKLVLLSPLLPEDCELPRLTAIKTATLAMVGTRDGSSALNFARRCREVMPSCHLSFIYGADTLTSHRPETYLDTMLQFLEEGEQFIIFRESQRLHR